MKKLIALLFVVFAMPAAAQDNQALADAEKYLNNITTMTADFLQTAPDGNISKGKFFLKRPGKMRWQYAPPTPILMVTSGKVLTYYDYELEQVSNVPVSSTMAAFVTRKNISFSDSSIKIDSAVREAGVVRIKLHQRSASNDGSLVLEFSDSPLQLRNMVVTDAQGQTTRLSLSNIHEDVKLDDEMFIFVDPRQPGRRNR